MGNAIPEQLKDWLVWAQRLKTSELSTTSNYREAALRLTDAEIAGMGEVYKRAHDNNDMSVLRQWLLSNAGQVPMDPDEKAIRNLLDLWSLMNRQSYVPFRKGSLRLGDECRATPDWSFLSKEFQFLAESALYFDKFSYSASEETRALIARDNHCRRARAACNCGASA